MTHFQGLILNLLTTNEAVFIPFICRKCCREVSWRTDFVRALERAVALKPLKGAVFPERIRCSTIRDLGVCLGSNCKRGIKNRE